MSAMFFTESAHIAKEHPELSRAAERVDQQLGCMAVAEVVEADTFASLLRADSTQVASVLEMLASSGVLRREERVDCRCCGMAVLRSAVVDSLADGETFRCSICDEPITIDETEVITTYRRIKSPRGSPAEVDGEPVDAIRIVESGDQAWWTHVDLAKKHGVDREALRQRLNRFRERSENGWKETDNCRPREPKYLYRSSAVMHIIEDLRASAKRTAK